MTGLLYALVTAHAATIARTGLGDDGRLLDALADLEALWAEAPAAWPDAARLDAFVRAVEERWVAPDDRDHAALAALFAHHLDDLHAAGVGVSSLDWMDAEALIVDAMADAGD